MIRPLRTHALASATGFIVLGATHLALAQQPPRPLLTAAERINSFAPQAVAQQTIRIGAYDAATKQFVWAVEPQYPPATPDYKKVENGGKVQPQYVVDINSRNVIYEFVITNGPANFQLSLSYVSSNGQTVSKQASIAGGMAKIDMTPPGFSPQSVRFNQAGAPGLRIWPRLRDQLGAFIVPYLLVSIVYEPPGAKSEAQYSTSTTAGTSMSMAVSRSSGFSTKPTPADTMEYVVNLVLQKAIAAGAALVWAPAGPAVAGVLEKVGGVYGHEVTFITDATFGSSTTQGQLFSITEEVGTRNDDNALYPGKGDLFVVLRDVLYLYVAYEGVIYMRPVAFSKADRIRASDLTTQLPGSVAQQYLQLDPHWNPALQVEPPLRISSGGGSVPARAVGARFRKIGIEECKTGSIYALEFERTDYQISTNSRAVTSTQLDAVTGLVAMATGTSGTTSTSVTYSSAAENYSSTSTAPRIALACDAAEGEFEVEIHFDNIFGTFFTRRGAPLSTTASLTGQAPASPGRPRSNQRVSLTIGGQRYTVRTDTNGNFRFRFASIPSGSGALSIGNVAYPVVYAGTPQQLDLNPRPAAPAVGTGRPSAPAKVPRPPPP